MSQIRVNRRLITLAASLEWFLDAYSVTIYALPVPLIAAEFNIPSMVLSGTSGSIFLVAIQSGASVLASAPTYLAAGSCWGLR
jgi:hypothetical protein